MDRSYPRESYFPRNFRIRVHEFSRWDEFETWWVIKGDLTLDLITYYILCSAVGFIQGLWIGTQIAGFMF